MQMVESAELWCAHLPAYGPTLSRQMRSEVGLILPPQTWQGEDMRAVMAIAMWVQSRDQWPARPHLKHRPPLPAFWGPAGEAVAGVETCV